MFVVIKMIDVSSNCNLQSKKFDYVRIAFILKLAGQPIPANQINFYFNRIFPQTYCNSRRISMLMKQKPALFSKIISNCSTNPILYSYSGKIILNKTTNNNWNLRSSPFFSNP